MIKVIKESRISNKVGYEYNGYQYYKIGSNFFKVKEGTYPIESDDGIEIDADEFNYARKLGDKVTLKYVKEPRMS